MKPIFAKNKDLKLTFLPHYDYFHESLCLFGNHIELEYYNDKFNEIDWWSLCRNPNAMKIIESNFHKVNWGFLSENYNAIKLLETNLDKVNWKLLSNNKNAIHLLEKNVDKIDWYFLASNINALPIMIKYAEKTKEEQYLIVNNYDSPKIFLKLDYEKMKENNALFVQELVSKVFHPKRLVNLCHQYNMTFDEINDCY